MCRPSGTFSDAVDDETVLLSRLRAGDERAFEALVAQHDGALRRVARSYVRTDSAVEDVVQEAWLGVVHGLAARVRANTQLMWCESR